MPPRLLTPSSVLRILSNSSRLPKDLHTRSRTMSSFPPTPKKLEIIPKFSKGEDPEECQRALNELLKDRTLRGKWNLTDDGKGLERTVQFRTFRCAMVWFLYSFFSFRFEEGVDLTYFLFNGNHILFLGAVTYLLRNWSESRVDFLLKSLIVVTCADGQDCTWRSPSRVSTIRISESSLVFDWPSRGVRGETPFSIFS